MKKLLDKAWAKATAFVLLCLTIPALIGSAAGLIYAYYGDWYDADDFFLETGMARNACYDEANWIRGDLWDMLNVNGLTDEDGNLLPGAWDRKNIEKALEDYPLDPAIGIRVLDEEGNELWDSGTEGMEPVVTVDAVYSFAEDVPPARRDGTQPSSGTDLAEASEESEKPVKAVISRSLIIEAYIQTPIPAESRLHGAYDLCVWLIASRTCLLITACTCLALSIFLFIFLMLSAGHKEGKEGIYLGGLNKLPLDLYTVILAVPFCLIFSCLIGMSMRTYFELVLDLSICILCIVGLTALVLALCMTLSARFKAGYWWRNTLIYKLCMWLWRMWKRLWGFIKRVLASLPLAWRTALITIAVLFLNILFTLGLFSSDIPFFFFVLLAALDFVTLTALILASAQFKQLSKAAHAIAKGDMSAGVDTSKMRLDLKRHGEDLNNISLGVSKAVDERMKSERFKTELITNVSHDLKTPLTSIVSYVDLLKKEEIENDKAKEYIEVLDRQSAKLKKLTEDLVEASKASSGALKVNRERLELGELVGQCRGEYTEKLQKSGVELICSAPERDTLIVADGRLLWRVLDNLMQNVCKYSLPGTRAYLNLERREDKAVLSVKNISREPLNIPAEELMERFVRGDASRSSEGSGLGLSIARSLTELMGGTLELVLDGDLFKAVISFDLTLS